MISKIGAQKKKDISESVIKIAYLVTIGVVFLFALIYMIRGNKFKKPDDPVEYIEEWTVTDGNGDKYKTGRSYYAEKFSTSDYYITATLPDDVTDDSYLAFTAGKDISIYVDGEYRYGFSEKEDCFLPGGTVKRFYLLTKLYASDSGKEIKLVTHGTNRRGMIVAETFITTKSGFYHFMFDNYGVTFIISAILFVFSLVLFIISIAIRILYRQKIPMLYGALSVLVLSAWLLTDSFLFPFVFGHFHIDGLLNYICCLIAPIGISIYISYLQRDRYEKLFMSIAYISMISTVLWLTLHLCGILKLSKALPVIDTVLGVEILLVFAVIIYEIVKGKANEYKYTAIGILGFLVFALIEVLIILFIPTNMENIPVAIGLAFLLTMTVIQQMVDLRRSNEERQRAIDLSEAKTKFLASMSHEIRTPINSILGMNEMILRENNDDTIAEYAGSIKISGNMLLMLVNDVLDFSKIEAGKLEINEAEYYLSELLHDVMWLIKQRAEDKGLKLKSVVLNEVPDGQISDEFRIRQILINLISNAVKYTDEGTVTLEIGGEYTSDEDYQLLFNIKDTGRGIRSEDIDGLFDAFARVDTKKNVNIEGTGLGLAIVKSVIDSMGGSVNVESEYGKGSEFIVRLPVKVHDKKWLKNDFLLKGLSAPAREDKCDFVSPDAKVLVVDDNQSNLTVVRLFLKRTEIVPDLCDSGKKAIELCKKNKYDIIFLDHMMPDPDGIRTLEMIRKEKDSLNKETKAVVLTANAIAGSRQIYMDAGFDDYLTKPLDHRVLEDTVKKYLPKEKVLPADNAENRGNNKEGKEDKKMTLKEKLLSVEGLDYEVALKYAGDDEEILADVIADIVDESASRCERMRKEIADKDYESYCIDAHAVKGVMAMIGLSALSERAKKHEFAVKDNDISFIEEDFDSFISEYESVCEKIR